MSNRMVITNEGLAECANASAGGYLVNIQTFKLGSGTVAPTVLDADLVTTTITSSNIINIQVTSDARAVEFTLQLSNDLPGVTSDMTFTEVGLFMPSGVMFARGLFDTHVVKPVGVAVQVIAVVAGTQCNLTTLNTTLNMTTFSVPSIPYIRDLSDPSISTNNVISVLDQSPDSLGNFVPGLAIKYGAGGNRWSFVGYNRIYEGVVDSNGFLAMPSEFKITSLTGSLTLQNNERLICQAISGSGAGQTRRIKYTASLDKFEECENKSFSPPMSVTTLPTHVCIWRSIDVASASAAKPWPDLPLDHVDYVLTVAGADGPKWLPPQDTSSNGAQTPSLSLYHPPSKLVFKSFIWTASGKESAFSIPAYSSTSSSAKPPESIVYTFVSVQGILQTRQSYEILRREYVIPPSNLMYESVLLFSENLPLGAEVELWYAYRETDTTNNSANTGARTIAKTFKRGDNLLQNGDRKFYLYDPDGNPATDIPDSSDSLFVSIGGIKQFNNTFSYVASASPAPYIEFHDKPPVSVAIEVTTLYQQTRTDTRDCCVLINNDFYSYDNPIADIELSDIPNTANTGESVNSYVFVNVSGIYIHRDKYTVIGNRILFSNMIAKRRPISVTFLKNMTVNGSQSTDIRGVVTNGLVSSDYIYLERHGQLPVKMPIPRVNIQAGDGILVSGSYPDIVLSLSPNSSQANQVFSGRHIDLYSQEDVEEIIYTYRFSYKRPVMLMLTCDFSCRLGPGFMSQYGREYIEYSIGVRSGAGREPAYGRRIKGTGEAGFSYLSKTVDNSSDADYAYANASISDSYEFRPSTTSGGYVDVVARMRVLNAAITEVHSYLAVNVTMVAFNAA